MIGIKTAVSLILWCTLFGGANCFGRSLLQSSQVTGPCISSGCTAQDIRPGAAPTAVCTSGCFDVGGNPTCASGSTITVTITESISFTTNANRYDFVTSTQTAGGNCDLQISDNSSPFTNLDSDGCGDASASFTYRLLPINLLCVSDANGFLAWNVCFGYDSNAAGGCTTPLQARNEVKNPKCKCASISLPVRVASCAGVTCPTNGGGSGACISPTGTCDPSTNCASKPPGTGICLQNQGPGGQQSCFYSYLSSTAVCRPSAGICDVPENCSGSSATCPADAFQSSSTVCRPSAGICDVPENCSGGSATCPADAFQSSSTVCRPSAGICDVPENCSGSSATCPADVFQPPTTVCRAKISACDNEEKCTLGTALCPSDVCLSTPVCPPGTIFPARTCA